MMSVIVLGNGRSGTTLVQRVLNTATVVHGENKGFWNHIYDSYKAWDYVPIWETKIAESKGQKPFTYDESDQYKPAWWNPNYEKKKQMIIGYYKSLYLSLHGTGGFKEIRIHPDLNGWLTFMRLIRTDVKFVFVYRPINEVIKSGWWKEKDREELKENYFQLMECQDLFDAFPFYYRDQDFKGMFEHLGIEYNEAAVAKVTGRRL